jgi:O-antigen/teichoic acid export membrane protein
MARSIHIPINKRFSVLIGRLSEHFSIPLFRNGYALITSSFLSSAIGMVYWILVARIYPANLVGLNSALISAMMLLGGIAQLNLSNANIRFIPSAGRLTRRFVRTTYLIGPIVAVLVSLIFLLLLNKVAPVLAFLRSSPLIGGVFVLATVGWCIFVLEDGVLTGLRRATWVPVENSMFGLIKIALMLVLASILPQLGVFFSWVLGLAIILGPTTYFIFRKLIPHEMQVNPQAHALPHVAAIARYTAGDYIAVLSWTACTTLLPIIVTVTLGPTANAYYYLSWQIALLLYAICASMGSSLIVEASTKPQELLRLSIRVIIQLLLLVVPIALITIIAAPLILSLFGRDYADQAAPLLRLLALSGIPFIITIIFVSVARVRRQIYKAILSYLSLAVLVLGFCSICIPRFGLIGVGYAWLAAQSLVAITILGVWLRGAALHTAVQDRGTIAVLRFGGFSIFDPGNRRHPLFSLLSKPWRLIEDISRMNQAAALMPAVLENINSLDPRNPVSLHWNIQYLVQTHTDMAIFALGQDQKPPAALLKLPLSDAAAISAQNQTVAFETICSFPQLTRLQSLLPGQISRGVVSGQPYLIEKMLPGLDGRRAIVDPADRQRIQTDAIASITSLHVATASLAFTDAALLDRWVIRPLEQISRIISPLPGGGKLIPKANQMAADLTEALSGRQIALSWVHGDFVPGNILVSPQTHLVTGIVDWELSHPNELPLLDVVQWILAARREIQNEEFGQLIRDLLGEQNFTAEERRLVKLNQEQLPGEVLEFQTTLLLFWLEHIHANLTKSTRYNRHWLWIYRNIIPVLDGYRN